MSDVSIRRQEISTLLPLFDPTECSLTNMWRNRQGARTNKYQRNGFFLVSFAAKEILLLLELLLNTACTSLILLLNVFLKVLLANPNVEKHLNTKQTYI